MKPQVGDINFVSQYVELHKETVTTPNPQSGLRNDQGGWGRDGTQDTRIGGALACVPVNYIHKIPLYEIM